MADNDQFDENAADLRNIQTATQMPQPTGEVSILPTAINPKRNVSWVEAMLAIVVMAGIVIGVSFFLQQQPASSSNLPLLHQPLPSGFNNPSSNGFKNSPTGLANPQTP